ncbi:DUF6247 family protein [Streptomyces sp. NPDC048257]|uniref:DUF6247 family protein n=1 Tax=Streptomyces sp. NPDC048257 TaxID=3365526 RepID=UPI00371C0488
MEKVATAWGTSEAAARHYAQSYLHQPGGPDPSSLHHRGGYRGGTTGLEEPVSAQPADHAPVPPYAPAPGAAAELRALLRVDRRADTWVPAFERDWAKALEDARDSFTLTPLHEVVRTWQLRVAAAPGRRPRQPRVTGQPWASGPRPSGSCPTSTWPTASPAACPS